MTQNDLTDALRGFTNLIHLEFSVEQNSGMCKLLLDLAKGEGSRAEFIRVEFGGVSNLFIKDFGGGITQLLYIVIEDIRHRQLDRINYQIRELERESLSFLCRTVNISSVN